MKNVYLIIITLTIAFPIQAASLRGKINQGNVLYNNGEFDKAESKYSQALSERPESDLINFNLGAALYKMEDFSRAIEHFQKAIISESEDLQKKSFYNLANSEYMHGAAHEDSNLTAAVDLLKRSLSHYKKIIESDDESQDAQYNYDLVEEELKRLQEKIQQQENKQCDSNKDQQKESQPKQNPQQEQGSQPKQSPKEQKQQDKSDSQQQQTDENRNQQLSESNKEDGAQNDSGSGKNDAQAMSAQQAQMLLEDYRQQAEPRGLYTKELNKGKAIKVLKDW
ncbi:MAG: tetratricopeptide repeat protein [Candidatus Omnitrophica bacterium]|nr:tetratricopeptide repeat protein [Candidatus Omnitrophota bacterium]